MSHGKLYYFSDSICWHFKKTMFSSLFEAFNFSATYYLNCPSQCYMPLFSELLIISSQTLYHLSHTTSHFLVISSSLHLLSSPGLLAFNLSFHLFSQYDL
jgi:hypothetical protein